MMFHSVKIQTETYVIILLSSHDKKFCSVTFSSVTDYTEFNLSDDLLTLFTEARVVDRMSTKMIYSQ